MKVRVELSKGSNGELRGWNFQGTNLSWKRRRCVRPIAALIMADEAAMGADLFWYESNGEVVFCWGKD